jgi:hypothetical protein
MLRRLELYKVSWAKNDYPRRVHPDLRMNANLENLAVTIISRHTIIVPTVIVKGLITCSGLAWMEDFNEVMV